MDPKPIMTFKERARKFGKIWGVAMGGYLFTKFRLSRNIPRLVGFGILSALPLIIASLPKKELNFTNLDESPELKAYFNKINEQLVFVSHTNKHEPKQKVVPTV